MKRFIGMTMAAVMLVSCGSKQDVQTLLVGTYTGEGSEGIYVYRFDQNNGEFLSSEAVGFTRMENPSFLTITEDNMVYAVSEMNNSTASLSSFRFDPENFSFTKLSTVPTNGEDPCHVSTNGEIVAVGNYSGGTMSLFDIDDDGAAVALTRLVPGSATGPDAIRQSSPHVHCCIFTPDGKYLLLSDFSGDRIIRYELSTGEQAYFPLDADSGPRHITFSPDGKQVYVISELSGDVSVFDYNAGEMYLKQLINADKVDARGAADIHVSPAGKYLYASLRLENDGIAVFRVAEDGSLSEVGYSNTGKHPRNFTISPNGKYLLCACRDSNSVEVYSIDRNTGLLTKTDSSLSLSKPVCLVWD